MLLACPWPPCANGHGERRRGQVKYWIDDAYYVIGDLDTGEELYFGRDTLVYPHAIEKVRTTGTRVAFTARGAPVLTATTSVGWAQCLSA